MKKLGTRWVNKKNFSRLGIVTASLLVLTQLAVMCVIGFVNHGYSGGAIMNLIMDCITLLFYFIVLNNYRLSENNLYQGYFATLLIIISDYIFPLILQLISQIFNLSLMIYSLPIIALVVYFIFLTIENKKRDNNSIKILKIVGIITAVVTIVPGIYGIYGDTKSLIESISNAAQTGSGVGAGVVGTYIASLFNGVARTIGLPLIFAFYPFVLYKERYI